MKSKDFFIITKALDFEHDEIITAFIQWSYSFVVFAERIICFRCLLMKIQNAWNFMSILKIKMWAKCVVTLVLIWIKKGMRTFIMILHLELHVLICKAIGNVHI